MTPRIWEVELSNASQADFREIVSWTRRQFGEEQAVIYGQIIRDALDSLAAGPQIAGAKSRDEIGSGYRTLHVARQRHRARHFILFRVTEPVEDQVIRVVRILHDAMDPVRHLPAEDQE